MTEYYRKIIVYCKDDDEKQEIQINVSYPLWNEIQRVLIDGFKKENVLTFFELRKKEI